MRADPVTLPHYATMRDAADKMLKERVRRLPIVKDGKLIGILVASDLVRHVGKKSISEEILEAMGRYPMGPWVGAPQ